MSAHQMAVEIQQELRRLPGNNRCVDCDAPYPQWATVSYGTFMCLECSGRHRGLGVHLSFVRSVTMDSWTDKQILHMQRGGNDAFREAFAAAGVPTTLSIQDKYNTPQAEAFRARLIALVENRPPVPLPRWDPSCLKSSAPTFASSSSSSSFSAGGDSRGVEALKGESEQDYVARQMRLKEEARARMQAKFGSGGMQGIGSSGETRAPPSGGGIADLSSAFGFLTTTVASAATTAVSLVKEKDLGSKVSSSWSYVQSSLGDPALTQNVKETASSGWSALANGASALLQKATNAPSSTSGEMPRFNGALAPSGKYSGVASDRFASEDNDSWLDSQLKTSPPKANSFSGLSAKPSALSVHSSSFSSSSSFGQSSFSAPSSTSSSSFSAPVPPPAPASASSLIPSSTPAPVVTPAAPAPAAPAKKKDVDFFAEFGF